MVVACYIWERVNHITFTESLNLDMSQLLVVSKSSVSNSYLMNGAPGRIKLGTGLRKSLLLLNHLVKLPY